MRNRSLWFLAGVWGIVSLGIPPSSAGVVVTRSGQVQIGEVTVAPDAVTVANQFGNIMFGMDKITWHDPSPAIESVLKAAQAAEHAGKDAVALHLYQVSRDQEAATPRREGRDAGRGLLRHLLLCALVPALPGVHPEAG